MFSKIEEVYRGCNETMSVLSAGHGDFKAYVKILKLTAAYDFREGGGKLFPVPSECGLPETHIGGIRGKISVPLSHNY